MTSVREAANAAPQQPAGPRCFCGTPIPYAPGKGRPRTYCSEACKSRMKRALRAQSQDASEGAPRISGRLGKGSTEFSKSSDQQVYPATAKPVAPRVDPGVRRFQGRKVMNRISGINACRGCGQRALDPDTGVIYALSERGYVVSIGWTRCGKIWFCPQCSAAIRNGRTEEQTTAALRWLAAGGILAVVVLTARHNRTTELDRLAAALWGEPMMRDGAPVLDKSGRARRTPGAYQRMLTAPAFYGRDESVSRWTRKDGTRMEKIRPGEEGIRHRIGYAGTARSSEVTRSFEAGWHPHMNNLFFLGATLDGTPANGDVTGYFAPTDEALAEWEDWLREFWTETLRGMDPSFEPSKECNVRRCKCGGKGHGVKVHIVRSPDDKALIEYLTKPQDGKAPKAQTASVAADIDAARGAVREVVAGHNKVGRRDSMTPFQMLYRLYDLEIAKLDPDDAEGYGTSPELRGWWAEYEPAMSGRRAIELTRGLRRHVGLTGDDSEEQDLKYAYEAGMQAPLKGGVILTAAAASAVVKADAELVVEECVGAGAFDSVADVVEATGGRHDHVTVAGAEQLEATRKAIRDGLEKRRKGREEFEQMADMAARAMAARADRSDDEGETE